MYEIINVEQGTQEWHDLRDKYYKTASRTPSVMDASPFMSREQLAMNLRGEYEPFYSSAMRQGNDLEDMVREKANILLDDTFMPLVGVSDGFLASLDGINFERDTQIEIKVSKKTFKEVENGEISNNYFYQIMHQMMVFSSIEKTFLVAYNPETKAIAISEPILRDASVENEIIKAWEEFDKEKDTLKVKEFDLSENKYFMEAVAEFKTLKQISDNAVENLNKAKEKLQTFYKGGKTFGGGITVSYAKESKTTKWADIVKQNKELLKDVDMSKYESKKAASYRITSK